VPRDHEAIAAVVARATHHHHPRAAHRAAEETTGDVGGAAPRVLHQHDAGDVARLDRVAIEGTHLGARKDRDHRLSTLVRIASRP
jgi:hypothetical protein